MVAAEKKSNNYYLKVLIGLLLMFGIGYIPGPDPITPMGMRLIGIFFGTIWLYGACGLIWPSLLAIVAVGMSGAYPNVDAAIVTCLGQSVIWQIIVMMAMCEGIRASGAAEVIARWILSRKALSNNPLLFTFAFLWAFFTIGVVVSIIPAIILTWTVFYDVAKILGYKKGSKYFSAMIVAGFLAGFMGGAVLPYRGIVAAMVQSFTDIATFPLNTGYYMFATYTIGTLFMLINSLIICLMAKDDLVPLKNIDSAAIAESGSLKLNTQQICLMLGFVSVIVYVMLTIILPPASGLATFLKSIGTAGFIAIAVVVLCAVKLNGKPIMDAVACMKNGVPWGIVLSVGTMLAITSVLVGDNAGVKAFLNQTIGAFLGDLNVVLFVFLVILITTILTGFFSNFAIAMIIMTFTIPLAETVGVSAVALGIGIIYSACLGCLTPGGSGPAPLLFGNENLPSIGVLYKYLIPFECAYVVLGTVATLLMNLIF